MTQFLKRIYFPCFKKAYSNISSKRVLKLQNFAKQQASIAKMLTKQWKVLISIILLCEKSSIIYVLKFLFLYSRNMDKFKRLYRLPNHRIRENTNMDSFVFCGKNWDYYFTRKNRDSQIEILENVIFSQKVEWQNFIDRDSDKLNNFLVYA